MIKLQKGDTVRLAQIVTQAEFGLASCDDDGSGWEIDGVNILSGNGWRKYNVVLIFLL